MYRWTPQASAARRRLPPPSILSLPSVVCPPPISPGLLGNEVSSSMTASAPDLRIAVSPAAASSASTSATSAPSSCRPCVLALELVIPVTTWPWPDQLGDQRSADGAGRPGDEDFHGCSPISG